MAVDEAGHGDHAGRVDDHGVLGQLEPGPQVVALADGDDLAEAGGDPDVALEQVERVEGCAAQRGVAAGGETSLREPADDQVRVDRALARSPLRRDRRPG